ncbi:hypothetical protein O181_048054 [Austropuccinia psidii MF-1]|uniref:Uncharacterized protein n=1 Tax=Austropuccinia psidii MF-1 TaxID=1389203 RepID=A0A9Q3DS26_9BASI|nr:hypothetical protein [Austropuccinia psidii MF-1]
MSLVHLMCHGIARNQPEDRHGPLRTRRLGFRRHIGLQNTEGNHTHATINLLIQQEPQNRELEGYGSIYSAPTTSQRFISMEHGQQEVKANFTLESI